MMEEEMLTEEDLSTESLLESINKQLHDELSQDEWTRLNFLLGNKNHKEFLPDDWISTLEHALAVMGTYPEYGMKSFAQIIQKCKKDRHQFGCSNMVGRENEVKSLINLLKKDQCKGIWIYGVGGLGKTVLAREACYRLYKWRKDVSLPPPNVDLKSVSSPCEMVRSILSTLNIYTAATDLDLLLQELVYRLKEIDSGTYIVLDNIENVYQHNKGEVLKILQRCLAVSQLTPVKWLVTSRLPIDIYSTSDIEGMKEFELPPLSNESAEELFRLTIKPMAIKDKYRGEILDITGNVPLAIRLVCVTIKDRFSSNQFNEDLLSSLKENLLKRPDMRDCIEFAFNSLSEEKQHHLLMLSIVEMAEFDIETVMKVLGIGGKEAFFLMMDLTNRQIVQRTVAYLRYCIHPLVASFLEEKKAVMLADPHTQTFRVEFKNAQINMCKFVQEKLQPHLEHVDTNFVDANKFVTENSAVLRIFLEIVSTVKMPKDYLTTEASNRYLSKLQEALHMTQAEKEKLYARLIEKAKGDPYSTLFWEIEEVQNSIDCNKFFEAEEKLNAIENLKENTSAEHDGMGEDTFEIYLNARLNFVKGRLLRRKSQKEPTKAITYFKKALELFHNTDYVTDKAMVLDAIGNAYFDQDNYDMALTYHTESMNTLKAYVGDNMHPYIALYEFNVGTVYLAKAEREFYRDRCMTQEARDNYQKALEIFTNSMNNDVRMGTNRLLQYSDKLRQRGTVQFRLGRHQEAIADFTESVAIKVPLFDSIDTNSIKAWFKTGREFLRWRQDSDIKVGTGISKQLLTEAVRCFLEAEKIIKDGGILTGSDKDDFIQQYRKLANAGLPNAYKKNIIEFCTKYEAGSSTSEEESSGSSSEHSFQQEVSDEGIDSDTGDPFHTTGIPYVERERQEQTKFAEEFCSKFEKLEGLDKKRRRASSSSDD